MRELLVQILHIFIMVVVIGFGIVSLVAGSGGFDHWKQRLKRSSQNGVKNNTTT